MSQDQDGRWDEIRVYFDDGTETTIYVHEDDDLQAALAQIADEEGLEIADYKILVD